jgi:hypothetical protein
LQLFFFSFLPFFFPFCARRLKMSITHLLTLRWTLDVPTFSRNVSELAQLRIPSFREIASMTDSKTLSHSSPRGVFHSVLGDLIVAKVVDCSIH